jgi:hypothetical protein
MLQSRKFLTQKQLNKKLTDALQLIEDAEGSEIRIQHLLATPDEEGCNWADDVVLRVGEKANAQYLRPHVRDIVSRARRMYNLES